MLPFTSADKNHLLNALSDRESGSVRQWFFLELAAQEEKGARSKRVHCWLWLLALLGPALLTPSLIRRGLTGAQLFQPAAGFRFQLLRQSLNDALLLGVSLMALLAGFDRLTASQQFALWLLAIGGAAWQIWRTRQPPPPDESNDLPGAEASLGLYGVLIAKGLTPDLAQQLITEIRLSRGSQLSALLRHLPELSVPAASRHMRFFKVSAWFAALLPGTWLLGLLHASWGWIACCLLMICASWLINRQWQTPALISLASLLVYALAKLVHWL